MIIITHNSDYVISVLKRIGTAEDELGEFCGENLSKVFFSLSEHFKDENIIWCLDELKNDIDFNQVEACLGSQLELLSYNPGDKNIFNKVLDFTNFYSTIINDIPRDVRFQTWIMSEVIGIANARLINKFKDFNKGFSFQFTLNLMSQLGSDYGVLHYSEPLLYTNVSIQSKQESYTQTLKFIAYTQKRRWLLYILFLSIFQDFKRIPNIIATLLFPLKNLHIESLENLYNQINSKKVSHEDTIDVLIPTLGRKKYLKDVLDDLAKQTHLPKNVIIIEQHPDENSESELDYIKTEVWPFSIKHRFIHQLGACNARNIGLDLIESKWVFMADDDIRIETDVIEETLDFMLSTDVYAVSIATYLPNQDKEKLAKTPYLWDAFSTCTSIVKSEYAEKVRFNMAYEFGYGEDIAYGHELRKLGCMIVYTPKNALLHLKAPMGGFRFQFPHPWLNDRIQPKPSPTLMYLYQSYMSKEQFYAFKWFLFFKQVIAKKAINLFRFHKIFNNQWERSEYWADKYRKTK